MIGNFAQVKVGEWRHRSSRLCKVTEGVLDTSAF